jgi:hypothetical protein
MSSAFLLVAVFRNKDGTLTSPEIWQGAVGGTPSELFDHWVENLDNFNEGEEPIPSHMLEIDPNGHAKTLPWNRVKETMQLLGRVII